MHLLCTAGNSQVCVVQNAITLQCRYQRGFNDANLSVLAKLLGIETVHSDKRRLWLVQFEVPWSKANYIGIKLFFPSITMSQTILFFIFWQGGNIIQKCKRSFLTNIADILYALPFFIYWNKFILNQFSLRAKPFTEQSRGSEMCVSIQPMLNLFMLPRCFKGNSGWGRTTLQSVSIFLFPFQILLYYCLSKGMARKQERKKMKKKINRREKRGKHLTSRGHMGVVGRTL